MEIEGWNQISREVAENESNQASTIGSDYSSDDFNGSNFEKEQSVVEGDVSDLSGSLMSMTRNNIDDIYKLYCKHAREVGFSVRKYTTRYDGRSVVNEKYYVCSCEGLRKTNNKEQVRKRKNNFTRTGCLAVLRVKLNDDGLYEVVNHNTIHNHVLTRKESNHLHRSERSITSEKASMIEEMMSSGMRASDSFRFMAKDAGGEEFVGHTLKDHFNFVNTLKIKVIEGGDAQTLIDELHQRGLDDKDFFFKVKLNNEGRLSNVFWRDSMMKEDYMIYGDVVVFDTTYRTNKYNLICGPFVGLDNHKRNVMFGCAFITDEKTESFEWLFEVFKKSMEDRSPVTMFTDQDKAIGNAIEKVFPYTRHRLCLWHLYQNAISRFSSKMKSDNCFKDLFHKCLAGCSNVEDFENCWTSMISKYELQGNNWFERLYHLREKWSTAFNKDYFSASILSSQRSESTNSTIGFKAKKTTNLTEFYEIFKNTVQRWRNTERLDEFKDARQIPQTEYPLTGILKHASRVYTLTIFHDFKDEVVKTLSTTFTKLHESDNTSYYNVMHEDGDESYDVAFHEPDRFVSCTCKKFEEYGLLCHHCLRIFHIHSVVEIPDRYIRRRWTKVAKKELWDRSETEISDRSNWVSWRHQMVTKYYNFIKRAQDSEEARRIIEDGYDRDVAAVEPLIVTEDPIVDTEVSSSSYVVLDPTLVVTKGRRKRIKGSLQKKNMKKNTATSITNQPNEFGSKTPNPRFF